MSIQFLTVTDDILKCPICDQYPNFFFDGEEYVLNCVCFIESHESMMDVKYYWNQLNEKIRTKIDFLIEKAISDYEKNKQV